MTLRLLSASVAAIAVGVVLATSAGASVSSGRRTFYLTAHARQCLISVKTSPKWVQVVPCSDAKHNMEVYAVGHGGWGHTPPAATAAYAIARTVCLAAYQRITGHPLRSGGWNGFWPDPGTETSRYGDKIICSYRTYPQLRALGSGWHVR